MVAYSYKKRFVAPIQAGLGILPGVPIIHQGESLGPNARDVVEYIANPNPPRPKRQTIRADRKRHARPGEELQHYCGMRTKGCFLIGRGRCTEVRDIVITFGKLSGVSIGGTENLDGSRQRETHYAGAGLDQFATMDGFDSWADMVRFWSNEHGPLTVFIGVLIEWEPL